MRLFNATDHARSLSQSLYTRNYQPKFNGFNQGHRAVEGFRDDDDDGNVDNRINSRGRGTVSAGGVRGDNGRRGRSMDPKMHRSSRDGVGGSNRDNQEDVGSGGRGGEGIGSGRQGSLSRMKSASPPRRWRSSSNEPLNRFKQQQQQQPPASSSGRASSSTKASYLSSPSTLARQVSL